MADLSELRSEIGNGLYIYVLLAHKAPSINGFGFHPLALIRAVNGLWPLGKEPALAVLRTYFALATANPHRRDRYDLDEERIFLILRLLFVRYDREPQMPPLHIGAPDVGDPKKDDTWPLFPLAVVRQIPFLLVGGYAVGGLPESPLDHVEYCLRYCLLREQPLSPETCPVAAVESLLTSSQWRQLAPEEKALQRLREMLRQQAIRALAPLDNVARRNVDALYPNQTVDPEAKWQTYVSEVAKVPHRWNPRSQQFESAAEI
jgi:hypothetical protein